MLRYGIIDSEFNIITKSEENFTEEEKNNIEETLISKINSNIINALTNSELNISDIEQIGIACPGTVKDGNIERARQFTCIQFPDS